jgi:RimJ/RimL family protein N-acetyltransferase
MKVKKIKEQDLVDLKSFIEDNREDSFRYYDKRDYSVINNHKYSALYYNDNDVVGYGHLEYENKLWLGIMTGRDFRGKGYGTFIMNDLIRHADQDIYLSVDISNIIGKKLYQKFGFQIVKTLDNHHIMIRNNKLK